MPQESASLPTVFFCLRANSDVDQIVPVIDALARRNRSPIRVIIYDPIKTYRDDFRIRYLEERHGVTVQHLFELPGIAWRPRLTAPVMRGLFLLLLALQREFPSLFNHMLQPMLRRLRTRLDFESRSSSSTAALTNEVLRARAATVVFDHTGHPLARAVATAARREGIRMIALPHSIAHLTNILPSDTADPNATDDGDWTAHYDNVVLPNHAVAARVARPHHNPHCFRVLGSPRFSQDWGATLDGITPPFEWQPGGTKVLLILSKHGPYVDWREVERVALHLSRDPRLALLIQPHPRSELSGIPAFAPGPRVRVAAAELPTASLIQWADLVVFWGTSVIYDALRLRKPTLHLAYLFRLHFDFESHLHSWRVSSFEDFRQRLEAFLQRGEATYSEDEARSCIAALVEPAGGNVANRYAELIESTHHRERQHAARASNAHEPAVQPTCEP